jgi:tetratricopeptide (TPR) repeat protein
MTPPDSSYRYWAFISYSSKDKSWARWLHRAIESYGIPTKLISHPTPAGHPAPKRFHPLFRDRDELQASADLGEQISEALCASRYLIVVCSRHAAQSRWVNKEVETFQALGRERRVLAIIVDAEPNSGDARECFPPALRAREPLAADARPGQDGKRDAKLKLIAGMLGVGFDTLWQRDAYRRMRSLRIGIAMAVLGLAGIGALAWYTNQQRIKAVQARHQAESILEYLLFDLRDALRLIGRLDIVTDVQKRVDAYYRELGVDRSDARILGNRGVAASNAGMRLMAQGDLEGALRSFREYRDACQQLVAAGPGDESSQFDLANSHVKIGEVLRLKGDLDGALASNRAAQGILQQLVKSDPSSVKRQRELAATGAGLAQVQQARGDLDGALAAYREFLATTLELAKQAPGDKVFWRDASAGYRAIGDILLARGDRAAAQIELLSGQAIAKRLVDADPSDTLSQHDLAGGYSKIGECLRDNGDLTEALAAFQQCLDVLERLAAADPSNAKWQRDYRATWGDIGYVYWLGAELPRSLDAYRTAEKGMRRLAASDPADRGVQRDLSVIDQGLCNVLREQGDSQGALALCREALRLRQGLVAADPTNARWQRELAGTHYQIALVLNATRDYSGAIASATEGMTAFRRLAAANPSSVVGQRDLCMSYANLAEIMEISNPRGAAEWWAQAHDQLAGMKQRGIMSASDEAVLDKLRKKARR